MADSEENLGTKLVDTISAKFNNMSKSLIENFIEGSLLKIILGVGTAIALLIPGFNIIAGFVAAVVVTYLAYKYHEAKSLDRLRSDFEKFVETYKSAEHLAKLFIQKFNQSPRPEESIKQLYDELLKAELSAADKVKILTAIISSDEPIEINEKVLLGSEIMPSILTGYKDIDRDFDVSIDGSFQIDIIYIALANSLLKSSDVKTKNVKTLIDKLSEEMKGALRLEIENSVIKVTEDVKKAQKSTDEIPKKLGELMTQKAELSNQLQNANELDQGETVKQLKGEIANINSEYKDLQEKLEQAKALIRDGESTYSSADDKRKSFWKLCSLSLTRNPNNNPLTSLLGEKVESIKGLHKELGCGAKIVNKDLENYIENNKLVKYMKQSRQPEMDDSSQLAKGAMSSKFVEYRKESFAKRGKLAKIALSITPFRLVAAKRLTAEQDNLVEKHQYLELENNGRGMEVSSDDIEHKISHTDAASTPSGTPKSKNVLENENSDNRPGITS